MLFMPVEIVLMVYNLLDLAEKPALSILLNLFLFVESAGQEQLLKHLLARHHASCFYGTRLVDLQKYYKRLLPALSSLSLHYGPGHYSRDDNDRRQGLAFLAMTESLTRLEITIPKAKWDLMPHFRWYPEAKKALVNVTTLKLDFDDTASTSLENVLRLMPSVVDLSITFLRPWPDDKGSSRSARAVGLSNLSQLQVMNGRFGGNVSLNVLRKHLAISTLNRIESLSVDNLSWLTTAVFDCHFDQLKRLNVVKGTVEAIDIQALNRIAHLSCITLSEVAANRLRTLAYSPKPTVEIWARKPNGTLERMQRA